MLMIPVNIKRLALFILLALISVFSFANSPDDEEQLKAGEKLKVVGWLQPLFRVNYNSTRDGMSHLNESSFAFNRARLGVTGNLNSSFSYFVMAELSSFKSGPTLVKAVINWDGLGHWARITTGKFKHPFSVELNASSNKLLTINRSKVVDYLTGPSIDYGLMISGSSENLPILGIKNKDIIKYSLALINGSGKDVYDPDTYKDVVFKLNFSPFSFISLGGSFKNGKRKDPMILDKPAGSSLRYGADLTINYKNLIIQSEYIGAKEKTYNLIGNQEEIHSFNPFTYKADGYFIQALYMMPCHLQAVAKFETFSGELIQNSDQEQAITLGFNYFFNEQTKVQLNYIHHIIDKEISALTNDYELTDAVYLQFQLIF